MDINCCYWYTKAEKITDSKGRGYFVLTGNNGELVESAVKQEKYHQVLTAMTNRINAIEHSYHSMVYDLNNEHYMFGPGLYANNSITISKIAVGVIWKPSATAADKNKSFSVMIKKNSGVFRRRINDGTIARHPLSIIMGDENVRILTIPTDIPENKLSTGDIYNVLITNFYVNEKVKGVSCQLWYKYV